MRDLPMIIAGGGIAGLAAALAAEGRDVRVLEKAPRFDVVGAGLQLGPNAVRALRKLGAWDAVASRASAPPAIDVHDGITGRRLRRVPLGQSFEQRFGTPYRVIHRADLQEALLEVAATQTNIEISTATEISGWRDSGDAVIAILKSGAELWARHIFACDGVKSGLRQQAFPGTAASDSGLLLHRALIAMPAMMPPAETAHITLWLSPGAHVVHYPVGRLPRLNVVATTAKSSTPQQAHARACQPLQKLLSSIGTWLPWPGLYAPPLPHWQSGGLTLLGDAAHATLPFLAQGAAMALEDAAALVEPMRAGLGYGAWAEAISARRQRATRLHQATLATGRAYHASGISRAMRNAVLTRISDDLFWQRTAWIYNS